MAIPPNPMPSAPTEGPCQPWTDLATVRARCNLLPADVDDAALTFGINLASLILWSATGRRYGLCLRAVRPCGPCQCFRPLCTCYLPSLALPGPVAGVVEVMVNGAVVPLTSIRIKTAGKGARRTIVRLDGTEWPCCNDLVADPTVVGPEDGCVAWSVTYWQGRAISDLARDAAGILAEQIGRQYCTQGGAGCDDRMVAGLTRISRRGVTREYDPNALKDAATGQIRTGLSLVDQWVTSVNPHGRVRPSLIIRPDDPARESGGGWTWVDHAGNIGGSTTATTGFVLPALHYVHSQPVASTTWVIPHNLTFVPTAFVEDLAGQDVVPDGIEYTSATTMTIRFLTPQAGVARLS